MSVIKTLTGKEQQDGLNLISSRLAYLNGYFCVSVFPTRWSVARTVMSEISIRVRATE